MYLKKTSQPIQRNGFIYMTEVMRLDNMETEDEKEYTITKKTPTLIYSGGSFGKGYAKRMIESGYNVLGIIDIKPENVKDSPVPVIKPEFAYEYFGEAFIWICLKDIFSHLSIARKFIEFGYSKILLLPFSLYSASSRKMVYAYNSFCLGNYEEKIPLYRDLWKVRASDYVLDRNSDFITVIVNINDVRAIYTDKNTARSNPFSLNKVTKDNPMTDSDFVPLEILENEFLEIFTNRRKELYQFFDTALYSSSNYFTECAAYAQLSESTNCWYIVDGYHRSLYLLLKGFKAIPLKVRKEEWDAYFKEEKAQLLMNYCEKLDFIPSEVTHPAFLHFPVKKANDEAFLKMYSEIFD